MRVGLFLFQLFAGGGFAPSFLLWSWSSTGRVVLITKAGDV